MQPRVIPQPGQWYPEIRVNKQSSGPESKKFVGINNNAKGNIAKVNTLAI